MTAFSYMFNRGYSNWNDILITASDMCFSVGHWKFCFKYCTTSLDSSQLLTQHVSADKLEQSSMRNEVRRRRIDHAVSFVIVVSFTIAGVLAWNSEGLVVAQSTNLLYITYGILCTMLLSVALI